MGSFYITSSLISISFIDEAKEMSTIQDVELMMVLWKSLNTETSQRGNASKPGFEEFPVFFGKSLKTGKC